MADTEESTQSELIKEVPDEVTEEHDKSVSPETAGPDVPLQTMPSSGASATVSTETARPDVPLKTTPNPGVSVTISTESAWPDVALQTKPNPGPSATVSTETAGPDVPLQTMPSPGASATTSIGFSLPCGGTACEDASQTRVIPAALSTDREVAPTTCEDTQRRNVSGPVRETGSSDVSLSNEKIAGSLLSLAGSESDSTVTTQPAGEAGSPAASQGDTIKVEVDYVEQTDEDMEEGEEEEEEVKRAPVISSAHEEGSFCSLDMGVDMVENMDTGTNEQIAQEVEKNEEEEEDKRTFVRQDSTESKSSIVNAVSIKENAQSLAILSEEKARGQSPHMEENKQQLDLSSSSSSGEVTARAVSTGPAAKDNPRVLKNGVRRRQRGELEKVEVKDEPVDEGYDKALAPTNAASEHVKDEPETEEDNLKISAVFSVGGASSPNVTTASPVLTSAQARDQVSSAPPLIPASMCVACSGCKKILTKGQTAYQKKGSSHLFCSTKCLTSYSSAPSPLIKPAGKRTCHYCLKDVQSPTLLIKAPVDASGTMKDFCGQACLTSFNFKRQSAVSTLSSPAVSSSSTPTLNTSKARLANKCSACKKSCLCYSHEVVNQGVMHKLCSDVCFKSFCSTNQLSLNSCTNCRSICQGKTPQMTVSGVIKSFCNTACQAAYKQKNKSPVPCAMCGACRPMAEMVEVNDSEGVVQLYCTTACVTAFKVQTVSASGAPVECENCRQRKVPAYHLAMSDSSIRNFCTLNCVLTFQEQFNKDNTQNPTNVAQTATVPPPAPPSQSQTSQTAPSTGGGTKLPCYQCHRLFTTKPELLQINDKLVFLCGSLCSEKYKKLNPTADRCEYCKIEKITTEVHRINGKDCAFCSEGCKLLYKHDLTKLWGRHCRSCSYCSSTSQKLVTGQFAGKYENFCSETCRSKYTMLFCQVAKCDTCGRQGKLTETLPMLGEVKHFCDLQCLMQFCSQKNLRQARVQTKVPISIAPTVGTTVANSANPVIANVVSLASTPAGQPNVFANTALQGAVPSAPTKIADNVRGGNRVRTAMVKIKTRDFFAWTDEEVELLLKVTHEYKADKTVESLDWELLPSKYGDILERYRERYPSPGEVMATRKKYPHKKDEITKGQLSSKLKAIRFRYKQAVNSGRKSGHGRVILLYFELCGSIWGGSPSAHAISEGHKSSGVSVEAVDSIYSSPDTGPLFIPGGDGFAERVANRHQRLDANLIGYKREKLKRKLSTDSVAQEDLDIKRRLLQRLQATDDEFVQTMGRWSSTMDRLNSNIELLVQHIVGSGTTHMTSRSSHTTHHMTPPRRPPQDSTAHEHNSPALGERSSTRALDGDYTHL